MATKRTPDQAIALVECVVQINPRGRSVITGTLVSGSTLRSFSHELSADLKKSIEILILSDLDKSSLVL
jgi:hypothetical protein